MITVILDTETTGLLKPGCVPLDEQPHIIEIGAIKVKDGINVDELSMLIKPPIEISYKITKITGITNDMVADKPNFADSAPIFLSFIEDADVIVAHNAAFDMGCFGVEFDRYTCKDHSDNFGHFISKKNVVCTVNYYYPRYNRMMNLKKLYADIMGKELKQTHRALDDCMALNDILHQDGFFNPILPAEVEVDFSGVYIAEGK